jgi:hypothetical protein
MPSPESGNTNPGSEGPPNQASGDPGELTYPDGSHPPRHDGAESDPLGNAVIGATVGVSRNSTRRSWQASSDIRAEPRRGGKAHTQTTNPTPAQLTADAQTDGAINTRVGILERWRQHRAERKRRVIVRWLRRTANHAVDTDPIRRRREALLHYRTAAVRSDLLEIAAILERAHTPNPACVATLHELLANGCDSPLYNPDLHVSELRATVHHVRAELCAHDVTRAEAIGDNAGCNALPARRVTPGAGDRPYQYECTNQLGGQIICKYETHTHGNGGNRCHRRAGFSEEAPYGSRS